MSVIKINIFNLLYSLMIYLPEDFYFKNVQDFPCQKAILVTAKTIARWSDSYEAKILEPKRGVKVKQRFGDLPKNTNDREKLTEEILNWIWENSRDEHYFNLYFKNKSIIKNGNFEALFSYPDNDDVWGLELSKDQFIALQKELKKNNLPEELFYEKSKEIIAIPKYYQKCSKLRRILFGGTYAFSPKTWDNMKKYGKDKKYTANKKVI